MSASNSLTEDLVATGTYNYVVTNETFTLAVVGTWGGTTLTLFYVVNGVAVEFLDTVGVAVSETDDFGLVVQVPGQSPTIRVVLTGGTGIALRLEVQKISQR